MNNKIKPDFKVGMTAIEVLNEILKVNPEVGSLWFYVYTPHYNVGESRKNALIPQLRTPLMPQLLFHDTCKETLNLTWNEITVKKIKQIMADLHNEDLVLGVLSKVKMKGKTLHMPMIDFSCNQSAESIGKIEWLLQLIGQKEGVILSSGRSYHYYGANLMDKKEWFNFLGDCGLSGLVDERYVFHRFKDQCGILCLTACPLRPKTPTVVSILA